jgi:hypothetical protein
MLRAFLVQRSLALWQGSDLIWVNNLCDKQRVMKFAISGKVRGIFSASSISHAALLRFRSSEAGLA